MCYLVVVRFAVGQALAFVVTVSQERFLTLSTHKMLQANPSQAHMVSTAISQYSSPHSDCVKGSSTVWLRYYQNINRSVVSKVLLLHPYRELRSQNTDL